MLLGDALKSQQYGLVLLKQATNAMKTTPMQCPRDTPVSAAYAKDRKNSACCYRVASVSTMLLVRRFNTLEGGANSGKLSRHQTAERFDTARRHER